MTSTYRPHQSSPEKLSHAKTSRDHSKEADSNNMTVNNSAHNLSRYHQRQNHNQQEGSDFWPGTRSLSPSCLVSEAVAEPSCLSEHHRTNQHDDESQSAIDFQKRIADVSNNDANDDSSVGINRHNYSPNSIRRILDQQEKVNAAFCHSLSSEGDGNSSDRGDVDGSAEMMNGCGVSEGHGNPLTSSTVTSTFAGAAGFFSRWMQMQRIKRQREALEKAVEEQRRILIRQSVSQLKRKQAVNNHELDTRHDDYGDAGLNGNETFQNVTSRGGTVSSLPFCGSGAYVDDEEEYSCADESRENFEQYMNTVRSSVNRHVNYDDDADDADDADDDGLSYDTRMDERDGAFMIGTACHSVSGQGVAVQLEMLEEPKHLDCTNDTNPRIKIQKETSTIPFILSSDQMRKIATLGLPASIMFSKWKRLYCLQRDGDSFTNAFLRKVHGQTRTLLVIQTTNHEIMGGYSNSPWESQGGSIGAAFYGSCQASLFKIDKQSNEVLVYNWTGNNRYVQVCDIHAKLLAFGGGGKDGSFGLCVEDDFSVGTTGRCETFNNDPLCDDGRFEILNVECWGFMAGF